MFLAYASPKGRALIDRELYLPRSWTGDSEHLAYVLAVSRDHVITTAAGRKRADALAATVPKAAWQRLSCGNGAKGRRYYDWANIANHLSQRDPPHVHRPVRAAPDEQHARHWARWRHRHQQRARHCHYQRQRQQDH